MKNPILKYGLLGALAMIFYFLLVYFLGKENLSNPIWRGLSLPIYLFLMYRVLTEEIAEKGIGSDFRALSRAPFAVFLLINLGYWLFFYGINLADPTLLATEMQQQIVIMKHQLTAGTGDPQSANELREKIQLLEKNEKQQLPLGFVFLKMSMETFVGFILAAGLVGILKMKD